MPRDLLGALPALPEDAGAERVTGRLGALELRDGLLLREGIALLPREGIALLPRGTLELRGTLVLRDGAPELRGGGVRGTPALRGGALELRDGAARGRLLVVGWLERGSAVPERPVEVEGRVLLSSRRGGGLDDGLDDEGDAPVVRRDAGAVELVGGR